MRIKSSALGVIILVTIFGGIALTSALNIWSTSSTKIPVLYQDGEFAGEYDPSDIRGSYTFQDVTNAFNVPVNILGQAFGVSDYENLEDFQLKNLEGIYENLKEKETEIGTDSVRVFVGLYTGLPISLDDTFLPKPAMDILIEKGRLTDEQQAYVKAHSVDILNKELNMKNEHEESSNVEGKSETAEKPEATSKGGEAKTTEKVKTSEEHSEDEKVVTGKTTFNEIISWGVSREKVEEIIGGKIPTIGMTISDYCRQNGIQFSSIKDTLNEIIGK
jgi:hypothetical protein